MSLYQTAWDDYLKCYCSVRFQNNRPYSQGKGKPMKKKYTYMASVLFLFIFTVVASAADGQLYLKNNIHAQRKNKDAKASYANWTDPGAGHFFLAVNTPVKIDIKSGITGRRFVITNQDDGQIVHFQYDEGRMGISMDEYVKLIAAAEKTSLDGFSQTDRNGIKEGKASVGMTKDAVRIALGYPAKHRTPSLQSNSWVYWKNRFQTMVVEFGPEGRVTGIRF